MYLSSDSATLNTYNLILRDSDPALATVGVERSSDSCYCPGAASTIVRVSQLHQ